MSSFWNQGEPGLTLPFYVHPELSFVATENAVAPTGSIGYTVEANYVDIISNVAVVIVTSGAGTIHVGIQLADQSGVVVWQIELDATQAGNLPAKGFVTFTPAVSTVTAFAGEAASGVAPLPVTLAFPGYKLSFSADGSSAPSISAANVTVTHIPTGPVGSSLDDAPSLVATPLVL